MFSRKSLCLLLALGAPVLPVFWPSWTQAAPESIKDLEPARLESSLCEIVDRVAASTVRIETHDGMGSGTLIDANGNILTSAHVIEGCKEIFVTLTDGRRFPAQALGINGAGDLALLDIEADNLTVAQVGDSDQLRPGQWVVAVGHPVSAFDDFQPTVSAGVIERLDGVIKAGENKLFNAAIVSDTPLSPGSSGGGLFDVEGRLVGVNAAVTRNEQGAFSVRINEFLRDAERLRAGEHFDRRADHAPERGLDEPAAKSLTRLGYFDANLPGLGRRCAPRTVEFERGERPTRASGIIVSAEGLVLGALRPFDDLAPGSEVEVSFGIDSHAAARLVAVDRTNDVALFSLPPREGGYDHFDLDHDVVPRRGQLALSLRRRVGLKGGIVGSPHRTPPLVMTNDVFFPDVIQVDIRFEARDLGAPVIDREGALLGMVIQHRLRQIDGDISRQPYGGFLLPTAFLRESLEALAKGSSRGERPVGFLGVRLEELTEEEKAEFGVSSGVWVAYAEKRFPAYNAGIRAGDVLLAIKNHTVLTRGDSIAAIADCRRGESVPVDVKRNGRLLRFNVLMADRSDF